jgi:DNA-binding transcriptional regulator YhcF (GntR family)
MMDKLKVEGHSSLYRDINSGAVINSNRDEYDRYMKAKANRENMINEINTLKQELDEIKQLLKQITNGN